MSRYEYRSASAADIEAFIASKASVGISCDEREWLLGRFDAWCVERGATDFDRETVEARVRGRKSRVAPTSTSWMPHIRQLGKFMVANGKDAYVLPDEFKAVFHRAEPYLLTEDEIERFFEAAASLDIRSPWAWQATCFFGLMSSCGLRTGECRRLREEDVCWDGCYIDIARSKANRERRLPVTDEVMEMLAACDSRTRVEIGGRRRAFFVVSSGDPVGNGGVGWIFRRIWGQAGLPERKDGKRPRPYDFRHRFAYANIERWAADGVNVDAMLPYLSRYMGHATLSSTYYHVHASPDFMAAFADAARPLGDVYPEVGFDD